MLQCYASSLQCCHLQLPTANVRSTIMVIRLRRISYASFAGIAAGFASGPPASPAVMRSAHDRHLALCTHQPGFGQIDPPEDLRVGRFDPILGWFWRVKKGHFTVKGAKWTLFAEMTQICGLILMF